MSYSVQNIRNVCLLGHGGSGKTSLAESLLYMTGAIDRMGKPADGNTVCDYDAEETRRQISISTSVAPLEYKGCKINILDTPGSFDFSGEVLEALQVSDAAIIVCSAKDGISVGLEKAWRYCEERDMPRFIYISKTDEENSDYNATFDALRERFGNKIAPIVVPIWDDNKKVTGIIDVLNKRAYEMQNGKRVEIELPEGKEDVVTQFNDALKESVAETSEEFMDKFFSGEDFTYVEMIQGLRQGVRELSLFPVLCGSAVSTMGSLMLMDNIVELLPNPVEGNMRKGMLPSGDKEEYAVSPGGVPSAFVFKTVSDQYGKYSFIKVISGTITSDLALVNARTGSPEKLGRLYTMRGKKAVEVKELSCGDIGAIGKLEKVKTGDTLCDARKVFFMPPIPFPEPCYSVAIVPKNYFPAVEKGLREACVHGPLAGYPVVNLKAVLYDGSYHPVDSSEIAFKTAAQLAYKAAMPEANPVLMEPIGELKVTIPDSYMGDVIGDLNKRRGRIMGMNPTKDGEQVVEAEVPMAEMSTYAIDLRAMTQSRGSFTFHFVRYEDCPPAAQQKAIEEAKALAEE